MARLQAAPWLRRETGKLSVMGLNKAVSETCVLRLVGPVGRPPAGLCPRRGAGCPALAPLAQLMNQAWSPPEAGRVRPLQPPCRDAVPQGLCAPAILLALPCA